MVTKTSKKVTRKKATKKKVTPKKVGRPTKYDPKYCEVVIEKMAEGYSKEAVAGYIGVSKNTFYQWAKANPEFQDAISIGETRSQLHWETKLVNHVLHTKNGLQINGQVFNLNMKNRFGWRDKTEVDVGNKEDEEFKFAFDLNEKPDHRK